MAGTETQRPGLQGRRPPGVDRGRVGMAEVVRRRRGRGRGPAITRVLLEQARLRPGDVVLDVGSGYGEPGLSAAAEVGEDGHVTCLDISGDMLAFAEERARGRRPGQRARSSRPTSRPPSWNPATTTSC